MVKLKNSFKLLRYLLLVSVFFICFCKWHQCFQPLLQQVGTCIVWPYDGPTGEVDANSTADQATHKAGLILDVPCYSELGSVYGVSCNLDPFMVYGCLWTCVLIEIYLNLAWRDRCLRRWAMCYHIGAIILIDLVSGSGDMCWPWTGLPGEDRWRRSFAVLWSCCRDIAWVSWSQFVVFTSWYAWGEMSDETTCQKYLCICARLCHLLAQTPIWSYV